MKVYVDNEDKDFLELCLKVHCVYDYIEYDSRYRDKLELVSLADYTKQVRKEVCDEITKLAMNKFEFLICDECYNTIDKDVYISSSDLTEILEQIQKN